MDKASEKLYKQYQSIIDNIIRKEAYEIYPLRAPNVHKLELNGEYLDITIEVTIKENYKTYRFIKVELPTKEETEVKSRISLRLSDDERRILSKHIHEFGNVSDLIRTLIREKFGDDKNE